MLFALFVAISVPVELEARAGGGHSSGGRSGGGGGSRSSSSGGSRSSSSSSSRGYGGSRSSSSSSSRSYGGAGGSSTSPGGFVALVVIALVVFVFLYVKSVMQRSTSLPSGPMAALPPPRRRNPLPTLHNVDPNFSQILFKAFAYLIYVKYHEWAGSGGASKAVLPYLMPQVKAQGANGPAVSGVLVEALEIENVYLSPEHAIIDVKFQATLMLAGKGPRARMMRFQN